MSRMKQEDVFKLKDLGLSNRAIARALGKETQESTVRGILARRKAPVKPLFIPENHSIKIFLGDVEVSPTVGYVFNRFKAFVSPKHVIREPYMLTFAGKWLDSTTIISRKLPDYPETFADNFRSDYELVKDLWKILDECDIFIAHNAKFDKGWANQRFAYYGMKPPSPYHVVDTFTGLKEAFSLPSNALEASANYFELERRKLTNEGIQLWDRCCEGDISAFEEMEEYNIGDVVTLEDLYLLIRPFMKKHPNVALYHEPDGKRRCVKCGSEDLEYEGKTATTYLSKFKVYRCSCCGSVMRDRKNIRSKVSMFNTLANVL